MTAFKLAPEDVPALLAKQAEVVPKAIHDGLVMAAHRGRALLVKVSPVDQGIFRGSWQVKDNGANGAEILNDAPHAGIIEAGARPHFVSREGIDALTAWVKRKITLTGRGGRSLMIRDKAGRYIGKGFGPIAPRWHTKQRAAQAEQEARSIAFAIATNLSKFGQKGLFLVRDNMNQLSAFMVRELDRALKKALEEQP